MSAQKNSPSPSSKGSKTGGKFTIYEDKDQPETAASQQATATSETTSGSSGSKHAYANSDPVSPFKASKLAVAKKPKLDHQDPFAGPGNSTGIRSSSVNAATLPSSMMSSTEQSPMDQILSSLRLGHLVSATTTSNVNIAVTSEDTPTTLAAPSTFQISDAELLAKLQQQQAKLEAQQMELAGKDVQYHRADVRMGESSPPSSSHGGSVATYESTMASKEAHAGTNDANALLHHQQKHIAALQSQLAQREHQLSMTQGQPVVRPASRMATSSPTEPSFHAGGGVDHSGIRRASVFNANAPPFMSRQSYTPQPISPTAMSDGHSVLNSEYNTLNRPTYAPSNFNAMRVMSGPIPSTYNDQFSDPMQQFMAWQAQAQGMSGMQGMQGIPVMQSMQGLPGGAPSPFSRPNYVNRGRGGYGRRATNLPNYGSYAGSASSFAQPPSYQVGMYSPTSPGFPSRPSTSLSSFVGDTPDYASSVASTSGLSSLPSSQALQSYINRDEPVNYRRMLDKTVNCNWKFIVDKIVHSNDQQASIFLQQKLKVGTAEQKFEIIEAIIAQAYPLMVNRFGNFLVQRCFEHGTPEQVVAIANSIRGNTLSLSMDSFGCHVIQKAFDSVPEEYRVMMVNELLRRIPETVIHRYACHVWQKLFELRWTGEPPAIMRYVNDALYGMWHEVALGETGSLVVQNIFENCVEDEKRQCIEEVLGNIDLIAHGQFGNWCIQHVCEHGAPNDMRRAVDHVLLRAVDYSIDQYASKVVEKCLKIKGNEFLSKYLAIVCEAKPERPRMPLIDIAADQYGNYLVQYILGNATHHHREMVASHVRKHMVSLRGSKFGSRVAMLCCNPAHVTRPGPGAGVQIQRYGAPGQGRFGSQTFN